jgi:hypothetical protein
MSILRRKKPMTADGMALYFVKFLGSVPVDGHRGNDVVADAINRVCCVYFIRLLSMAS